MAFSIQVTCQACGSKLIDATLEEIQGDACLYLVCESCKNEEAFYGQGPYIDERIDLSNGVVRDGGEYL